MSPVLLPVLAFIAEYWRAYAGIALIFGGSAVCIWLAGLVAKPWDGLVNLTAVVSVLGGIIVVIGGWSW